MVPVASGSLAALPVPPLPSSAQVLQALALLALVIGLVMLAHRLWLTRSLRSRTSWRVLSPPGLTVTPQEVIQAADGVSHAARRELLRSASAIRVEWRPNAVGRMEVVWTVPARAADALKDALAIWPTVTITPAEDVDWPRPPTAGYAISASQHYIHGEVGGTLRRNALDVSPLIPLAAAMSDLKPSNGDDLRVRFDLTPMRTLEINRYRKAVMADALGESTPEKNGFATEFWNGLTNNTTAKPAPFIQPGSAEARMAKETQRRETAMARKSVTTIEPHFRLTITIVAIVAHTSTGGDKKAAAQSAAKLAGRATAALAVSNATAQIRERFVGFSIFGRTIRVITAGSRIRRRSLNRRINTGWAPVDKKSKVVASGEVAFAFAPAISPDTHRNTEHSPGYIPAAPDNLPEYRRHAGLLPIGMVESRHGRFMAGVPADDSTFVYENGRSRWGKTGHAQSNIVAQATDLREGVFMIDPEGLGVDRLLPYLTTIPERVRIIDPRRSSLPAWNPFDMEGIPTEHHMERAAAHVAAIATANGWGAAQNRAVNLTTKTAATLIELSAKALARKRPDMQTTVFQAIPLLTNTAWREAVLPILSDDLREFWTERFPRLSSEATGPVTQVYDRLASHPSTRALLGRPQSTYRIEASMAESHVVLVALAGLSANERTIANLLLHNFFDAAAARSETAPRVWGHFDEVQSYDDGTEQLPRAVERVAKRRVNLGFYNQSPSAITVRLLRALLTNASGTAATATEDQGGAIMATNLGGGVTAATIMGQPKYHFVVRTTINGNTVGPFQVVRRDLRDLWGDLYDVEGVADLMATVDANMDAQPIAATLDTYGNHHRALLDFWSSAGHFATTASTPRTTPRISDFSDGEA